MIPLFLDSNAPVALHGITDARKETIKNPIVFGSTPSITLNNPADSRDSTYDVSNIVINSAFDETLEPLADRDGSLPGEPREVQKIIEIDGWVRGSTLAGLYDKINALGWRAQYVAEDGVRELCDALEAGKIDKTKATLTLEWYKELIVWNERIKQVALDGVII